METKKHTVIIEKNDAGLSAYLKNANVVKATGKNEQELKKNMIDAIDSYYSPSVHQLKLTYIYSN